MTVSKLIVGGFKSLRDTVEIPLAPITLMFGPNSAGKSVVRDALFELRDVLTNRHSAPRRWFESSVPGPRGHWRPNSDPMEDPTFDAVELGCEVVNFNGELNLEETPCPGEWALAGQAMQESLVGHVVSYRIKGTEDMRVSELSIAANGASILECMTLADQEASCWLRLHLQHSVWQLPGVASVLAGLRKSVQESDHLQLNQLLRWEGAVLDVRQLNSLRYSGRFEPWQPDRDRPVPMPAEGAPVDLSIRSLYEVVNEFVFQVAHGLSLELDLTHVSGSRSVLSQEDASTAWVATFDLSWADLDRATVQGYAQWLGMVKARPKQIEPKALEHATRRDDFVNDMLAKHVFSARRYQVRPAVELRTEEMLLKREPTEAWGQCHEIQTRLYLEDEQGRCLDFQSVGSGLSYMLPILAALGGGKQSLIEQPELHLHPSAQCEMGDVIVRAFNLGRFSIVETHSEHLLLRILRRIRQTSEGKVQDRELQCQPEAVVVLYFAPDADGSTQVHQLRVTRGGDFMDRWPDGFFEERSKELFDE